MFEILEVNFNLTTYCDQVSVIKLYVLKINRKTLVMVRRHGFNIRVYWRWFKVDSTTWECTVNFPPQEKIRFRGRD